MPRIRSDRPRVVVVRGHQANPWELGPWELLADRFEVSYLRSRRNWFDTDEIRLSAQPARTLRGLLPPGRLGDAVVRIPGDRYLGLEKALRGADLVHAQELGYWYSAQAARLKRRLGYRLVLTVWETLPFLDAYRNFRTRAHRRAALRETDLFLAATERARTSLLLEGAPAELIRVCPPGVATDRFAPRADETRPPAPVPIILSPGRLVWEKGHQDVIRAIALLRRGLLSGSGLDVRLCIVGTGPEEGRLRAYARELGVADAVDFRGFIPYKEMPRAYLDAACVVLASLSTWSWEEQFGMVLAEAMAAGVTIVGSSSGAIPEVAAGAARYFSPGDWVTLARVLGDTLSTPHFRRPHPSDRFSLEGAAARLASAYGDVLSVRDG